MFGRPPVACSLLLVLPLLLAGCGTRTVVSSVELTESVRARSLLVSEILAAEDRSRLLDCPIRVENLGDVEQQLTVVATGCSCYGLTLDGKLLERDKPITIPPGTAQMLGVQGMPPDAQNEKDYEATLTLQAEGSPPQTVAVRCRLNVYQDVRLTPNVLTCETEFGEPKLDRRTLTIQRVFRAPTAESPEPDFQGFPEQVTLESLVREGDPEQLEEQLWRITWKAVLTISVPADAPASPPLTGFDVRFEADGKPPSQGSGQLVIRSRAPIAFPREIHFGRLKLGQPRQRRIMLASTDAEPFLLTVDDNELPDAVRAVVGGEPNTRQFVDLHVTPSEPGEFEHVVTLHSDRRAQPTIAIGIKGVVDPDGD